MSGLTEYQKSLVTEATVARIEEFAVRHTDGELRDAILGMVALWRGDQLPGAIDLDDLRSALSDLESAAASAEEAASEARRAGRKLEALGNAAIPR